MYKNTMISILAVMVMETTGFIQPSNTAAYIIAPMAWYAIIMGSLQYVDYRIKKRKLPWESANSTGHITKNPFSL